MMVAPPPKILTLCKAFAQNVVVAAGGARLWRFLKKTGEVDTSYLEYTNRKERFTAIYDQQIWASSTTESLSGDGSSLAATNSVRKTLPGLLAELGVRRLLDLGCGDFNWMKEAQLDLDSYVGADIVDEVIAHNQQHFADQRRRFIVLDGCAGPLPEADAVLCRDTIFHLSFNDAKSLLQNVRCSGAKYLITTTNPEIQVNKDIPSAAFREINLSISPYRLGHPDHIIPDGEWKVRSRVLGVWPVEAIPAR
jgi:SAM-dependent methyltransferase